MEMREASIIPVLRRCLVDLLIHHKSTSPAIAKPLPAFKIVVKPLLHVNTRARHVGVVSGLLRSVVGDVILTDHRFCFWFEVGIWAVFSVFRTESFSSAPVFLKFSVWAPKCVARMIDGNLEPPHVMILLVAIFDHLHVKEALLETVWEWTPYLGNLGRSWNVRVVISQSMRHGWPV